MGKLNPETSVVTFYRRSLKVADSLISDAGENSSPALDTKELLSKPYLAPGLIGGKPYDPLKVEVLRLDGVLPGGQVENIYPK